MQSELNDLAGKASIVQQVYRKSVERLRELPEIVTDLHDQQADELEFERLRNEERHLRDMVDRCWGTVQEIAESTIVLLPDLSEAVVRMRLDLGPWHFRNTFPWDAALAELCRIEGAARKAAAPSAVTFSPNAERNAWIYQQAKSGTAWKVIVAELGRRENWDPITTIQGVRSTAKRHAEAHGLELIPPRRRGRKSAQ